jgi:putative membrane protein
MPELSWLAAAFPNFVRYVVTGFALAGLFLSIYVLITPWREFALIRAGNSAAAIALIGALLGFCLPLANTIAHSVSLVDVVLWSLVALVVQVIVHVAMRLLLPDLKQAIEADRLSAGVMAGGFATCFGLINAACLTT